MPTLAEIRAQYPAYGDMPDADLADALYQKFYSDLPREQFNAQVGYAPPLDERQRAVQQNWQERRAKMGPLPEPTPEQEAEAQALVRAELGPQAPVAAPPPANPWAAGDQEADTFEAAGPQAPVAGGGLEVVTPRGPDPRTQGFPIVSPISPEMARAAARGFMQGWEHPMIDTGNRADFGGLINQTPEDAAGPLGSLRAANEVVIRGGLTLVDYFLRAGMAVPAAITAAAGQLATELGFDKTTGRQLERNLNDVFIGLAMFPGHATAPRGPRPPPPGGGRPVDFYPGSTEGARPPAAMPAPGEAIGLQFPNAPPRRATIEGYFDDGRAVRVRFDDGSTGDYLASDVARDRVEAPPAQEIVREGAPPPGPTEVEAFDMMMAGDLPAPAGTGRGMGSLTREAEAGLLQAAQLERMAADMNRPLAPGQREAYVQEAAMLRARYGAPREGPRVTPEQEAAAAAARERQRMGPLGETEPRPGTPPVDAPERFETARMGDLGMARLRQGETPPERPAIQPPVREEPIAPTETAPAEVARPEPVQAAPEAVESRPEIPQADPSFTEFVKQAEAEAKAALDARRAEGDAPLQESGFVTVSPDMLTLDPERFQYKASQGPRGVTGALHGVERWEPALATPITAWLGNDGKMYVVNGHQRTDLALRAQAAGQEGIQMPARVFREADGYTAEDMRVLGAIQNIAEGTGTASDAARVLRQVGQGTERFKLPELPPRSQLVQDARALAKLSDDAFKMVENGVIPEAYAAQVGRLIEDPREQIAAIDALAKADPANVEQARIMVEDIRNSGFLQGEQTTLFGTEQVAQSLFGERARVLENALRTLRRTKGVFKTAVEEEGVLAGAGNRMEREANIKGKTENERLYATLRADATRRGPISDALRAAAAEVAEGKPVGPVTSRFLAQARRLVKEGEAVRPGAEAGRAGDAGEGGVGKPSLFQRERPAERPAGGERVSLAHDVEADMRPVELLAKHEKALLDRMRKTAARMFPGARVGLVDRLYGADDRGVFSPVTGAYLNDPRARALLVSLQSPDAMGTMLHEGIHDLYRAGYIPEKTWGVLEKAADDLGWVEKHDIEGRYERAEAALAREEAIAEQFRTSRRNSFKNLPEPVRRIFQQIERMMRTIRRQARSILGRDLSAEDIFNDIETGRLARQPKESVGRVGDEWVARDPDGRVTGVYGSEADARGDNAFYRTREEAAADAKRLERATGYSHLVEERTTPGLEDHQFFVSNRMMHARELMQRHGVPFKDLGPEMQAWVRENAPELAPGGAKTEKIPTVEGPRDQFVIPGTEHSAVQASKARGETMRAKAPQREADTGVFAGKKTGPEQGSLFQRPEQPTTAAQGREYYDNVADSVAESVRAGGPGNYERRLAELLRPTGQMKELGSVERWAIIPRTLARIDEPSAKFWDAWSRRDDAVSATDSKRIAQAKSYVALDRTQQRALHAVEELDRINGTVRPDDGRAIVARNDGIAQAELSAPGDAIALDAAATQAYRDRRVMFRDVWHDLVDATAKKMGWDGPADPVVIRASADLTSDRASARNLRNVADLVENMQQQERAGYVPLMRFGDHYIAVKPKPGREPQSLGGFPEVARFELVESQPGEWRPVGKRIRRGGVPDPVRERIAALREKYPEADFDLEHGQLFSRPDLLRKLDIPAVEKLAMLLTNDVTARARQAVADGRMTRAEADRGNQVFRDMVEFLRDEMYRELKAGFKKRARTIPGYSTDFRRATGAYLGWTTRHAADLVHGDEIRRIKTDAVDRHPNRAVREYWDRWAEYQDRDPSNMEALSTGLQRGAFLWQMAANPSSAAVNLFDTPVRAHPNLMIGNGLGRSGVELYGALRQALSRVRVDGTEGLTLDFGSLGRTPGERALIADLEKKGVLRQSLAHDLAALGQDRGAMPEEAALGGQRAFRIAASNLSVVDKINRASVALAAYRLAQKPGALQKLSAAWGDNEIFRRMVARDGLTPETYARFLVDEGLGVWGQRNRAPMQRGWHGTMMFQWKNYYAQQVAELTKMLTRMGPDGKKAAAMMLGTIGATAGTLGLPFAKDVGSFINMIWNGATGDSGDVQEKLQTAMVSGGVGKEAAEMILVGPSRQFLGVDLAPRLGFGDQLSQSLQPIEILGAVPGMVARLATAVPQEVKQGRYGRAATELLPSVARNPATAFGIYPTEGVRTRAGSQVLTPDQITLRDKIARTLGFQPAKIARAYEERTRVTNLANKHREKVRNAVARIADLSEESAAALARGDRGEANRIDAEIARIAGAAGVKLTPQQIKERIRSLTAPVDTQLRRAPRAVREKASESPFPPP